MGKRLICKKNGKILADWQENFQFAILFKSVPVAPDDERFEIMAFNRTVEDNFEHTLYAATVDDFAGEEISFFSLPASIQRRVRSYYGRYTQATG